VTNFTPISALIGGVLIGVAASIYLLTLGKTAGISGILGDAMLRAEDRASHLAFLGGLLVAGLAARIVTGQVTGAPTSIALAAGAGLLVGFGTRLGNGCTSGHGVCGLSSLSPRSLVATLTFIGTGVITVAVVHALGGLS
jgi:hypothetical protein